MPIDLQLRAVLRPWLALLQHPAARLCLWLLALLYVASLLGLGATPAAVGLANPPWDKVLHFAAYGMLTTLLALALGGQRPLAAIFLACLVACTDEALQLIEPGRHPGLDDLLADVAAAILAALLCRWLCRPHAVHEKV